MRFVRTILFLLIIIGLSSCAIRKYVPEGKTILTDNIIINDSTQYSISKSDISNYIVQKPNRTVLGWMPRVWVYYKTQNKTNKKFYKWVNNTLGVAPVYYNEASTTDSRLQMEDYLDNIGFFKSKVTPTVTRRNVRAKVKYNITPKKPYTINSIRYKISDTAIAKIVNDLSNDMLLKEGDNYNVFTLYKDREMITSTIRDNGYFLFMRDYIWYEVDTNLMQKKADITLRIDDQHDKFYINKVFIYPDFKVHLADMTRNDTVPYEFSLRNKDPKYRFDFIYGRKPKVNPKTFRQVILIHPGEEFSQKKITQTYRALGSLKLYTLSNISFDTVPSNNDSVKYLNCNVTLQKGKIHYYNIQVEGTNSGGDLGFLGSISYRNNNIFRGSEVLRISLKGGVQAQRVNKDFIQEGIFNTKELGAEASITFPRFLSPFIMQRFVSEYQPNTLLTTGYNMQIRPLYMRYIMTASFGYNWRSSNTVEHFLTPINLNTVKVLPTELFASALSIETNQRIKDQYTDHLILGLNYSFVFSNQDVKKKSNDFFYLKFDIETSGNLLSLFNNTNLITTNDNYHEIIGIRYAQFFKYQIDLRFYHYFRNKTSLALRMMYGQGIAYGNSIDLPFERSFYAGGANGMRGWQFRTLGPGEYNNSKGYNIEHIGDLQLESNIEYRFPIYGFIHGAVFSDLGNIWTLSNNESFPGGQFKFDKFYKQLAMDAGFGIRFDFSFFLIRLDVAVPLCDPAYDEAHRWRVSKLQWKDVVWNFGIGYPF